MSVGKDLGEVVVTYARYILDFPAEFKQRDFEGNHESAFKALRSHGGLRDVRTLWNDVTVYELRPEVRARAEDHVEPVTGRVTPCCLVEGFSNPRGTRGFECVFCGGRFDEFTFVVTPCCHGQSYTALDDSDDDYQCACGCPFSEFAELAENEVSDSE